MATKLVKDWTTECSCGYGRGGWASSPALKGLPIITRETTHCPGCGEEFTEQYGVYYEDDNS